MIEKLPINWLHILRCWCLPHRHEVLRKSFQSERTFLLYPSSDGEKADSPCRYFVVYVSVIMSAWKLLGMLELIVEWLFWMIKHAKKWLFTSNFHFNAMFRPSGLRLSSFFGLRAVCLTKPGMGETLHWSENWKWRVICWRAWSSKIIILLWSCHWNSNYVL